MSGVKLIGNPVWVMQPDSLEVNGNEGDEVLTVKYAATEVGMLENLPKYGDHFTSNDPFFSRYDFLILTGRNVRLDRGGKTYSVTLTYGTDEMEDPPDATVRTTVEYDTQDTDVNIEQHFNYKMNWSHVLLAAKTVSAVPSWWATATGKTMSASDAEKYAWASPNEKVPDGWYVLRAQLKRGVESYRDGITTVIVTKRSASLNLLARDAELDFTIGAPPKVFNRKGQWLRGGSKIRKNGRLWELTVAYLHSRIWDQEIYPK